MAKWLGTAENDTREDDSHGARLFGLGGNDTLTANGVGAQLYGGDGADVLIAVSGLVQTVAGGAGDDVIRLYSHSTEDHRPAVIDGGEGFDILQAQAAFSPIRLQSIGGIEWIQGSLRQSPGGASYYTHILGSQADNMFDFSHTVITDCEYISGGGGNDVVIGSAGDDTIAFSPGQDRLTGGLGADTFRLEAAHDTGPQANARDVITDFKSGEDHLDLSLIDVMPKVLGRQPMTFIGGSAFDGQRGELRFEVCACGNTVVEGDINGDGVADFSFVLLGAHPLTANDFIL